MTAAPPDRRINANVSLAYWNSVPATSAAMLAQLGEYPWYTRIDLRGSKSFLAKVRRLATPAPSGKLQRAVDCGAGVGRVTEGLLCEASAVVDIVEPVEKFANVVRESDLEANGSIGQVNVVGLQDWDPGTTKYDLVWIQFCVNYLTDVQLLAVLLRARDALTETGLIVVKENLSTDREEKDMYDAEDSSVIRTDRKFRSLFRDAKLNVTASDLQTGFPKHFKLLPVRMYGLRPQS